MRTLSPSSAMIRSAKPDRKKNDISGYRILDCLMVETAVFVMLYVVILVEPWKISAAVSIPFPCSSDSRLLQSESMLISKCVVRCWLKPIVAEFRVANGMREEQIIKIAQKASSSLLSYILDVRKGVLIFRAGGSILVRIAVVIIRP